MSKISLYITIPVVCVAAYLIIGNTNIKKDINYISTTDSEVYMAWGQMDGEIPSNDKWPPNTYFEGNLLFTKMNAVKDSFFTSISLPAGTEIYYWMVQRKDKDGNETDI